MVLIPRPKVIVMPYALSTLPVDEYKELTGLEPKKGEEVLFVFPKTTAAPDGSKRYMEYGVQGRISSENTEGYVIIETLFRCKLDFEEEMDSPEGFPFNYYARFETDDISKTELDASKARILSTLSKAKDVRTEWVDSIEKLMKCSERPEIILSVSPLNATDFGKTYEILAEDSLRKRTEMTEAFVMDAAFNKNLETSLRKLYPKGETDHLSDIELLEQKVKSCGMPPETLKEVERVLNRLKKEPTNSSEYSSMYDYVKYCCELPWKKEPFHKPKLDKARKIMDRNHFGMDNVKERIIQELSVMALNHRQSGAIFCLVGAPGVGKTSICKSVAEALGRKYARISLGGANDVADIRGHRRTYMGSMPGRIIDAIYKCGTTNPVIVLDEVDKLCSSVKGDPAAALLEVLDPEQNSGFTDHYLNFPYDLSDVMFVCTANSLDTIPAPLLNRMEVICFDSYTPSEKFSIAVNHLIPQAVKQAGLPKNFLTIPEETIREIITNYTMEGGVRNLRKCFDKICAKSAEKLVLKETDKITLDCGQLGEFLDMQPVHSARAMEKTEPGVVTGLAYTQLGGKILYIETLFTKGSGKTIITGQLGDVMKESAQIAVSLVKSMYPEKSEMFETNDLHIHVPDGAVPKDGPSAGIALTTALASLVTGKAVDGKIAMTGEVSLRGSVSAIGGLREKLTGAKAAGIKTIFIPDDNRSDLERFPKEILEGLNIIPVSNASTVLELSGINSM